MWVGRWTHSKVNYAFSFVAALISVPDEMAVLRQFHINDLEPFRQETFYKTPQQDECEYVETCDLED